MITVVWGDIFKAQRDALVVPVNIIGTMGAGLAREVALRYPDAYRAYRAVCDSGELRIGTLALLDWMHPKLLLFPTKGHWREKSTLETIECGLVELCRYEDRLASLAIPALGCGLGGLRWQDVLPLMTNCLQGMTIPVDIYKPGW